MNKQKNRVKQFRVKSSLTQRELAARAGTYYQQVQRIETYQVEARLDLAIRLSKALGKTLDEVFPGVEKALAKSQSDDDQYLPPSLNEYGIETDIRTWSFKLLLKGHKQPFIYEVPASEKRRLQHCLANLTNRSGVSQFIVFDTLDRRIALNTRELQGWQFLFDVDFPVFASDTDRSDQPELKESASSGSGPQQVNIFFVGNSRAWSFGVEHDAGEWVDWDRVDDNGYLINADGKWIDDEGNLSGVGFLAIEHDEGELRYILDSLETGADEDDIHHFEDEDGETMYFHALEIALFEVPLSAIKPWDPEEEDEEE
jgi:putative transcriptional regulator